MKTIIYMVLLAMPLSVFAKNDQNSVSITISPISLLLPVVKVTTEMRLDKENSFSLIGGYGVFDDPLTQIEASVKEFGFQYTMYEAGDFNYGKQYGFEFLAATAKNRNGYSGVAFGFGPYIGYKATIPSGLVGLAQFGIQYVIGAGSTEYNDGLKATGYSEGVMLLFNVKVGWSI